MQPTQESVKSNKTSGMSVSLIVSNCMILFYCVDLSHVDEQQLPLSGICGGWSIIIIIMQMYAKQQS